MTTETLARPSIDQLATPHITPGELDAMHPLTPAAAARIRGHRQQIIDIMEGRDPRMILMLGPCSMDDSRIDGRYTNLTLADRIQEINDLEGLVDELLVVMRVSRPKPRSDLGLRGLIQKNPVAAHEIMTSIANKGLPFASEVMNAADLAEMSDRLALGWLGARNVGDTNIRHTMSAYADIPFWVKNDGYGNLTPALKAIKTIGAPHENVDVVLQNGQRGVVPQSAGNPHTGLLWRGGDNYTTPDSWKQGLRDAAATGVPLGIDLSHGGAVAHDWKNEKSEQGIRRAADATVAEMLGGTLMHNPKLITLEVNLLGGADTSMQTPGRSWTDACISIDEAPAIARKLAEAHANSR
jgi:3-deoxy-7-phosphoheptulonate synthase